MTRKKLIQKVFSPKLLQCVALLLLEFNANSNEEKEEEEEK